MRRAIVTFALWITCLSAVWCGQDGTQRVTLDLRDVTPAELFQSIQAQTGLDFIYNVKDVVSVGKISISVREEPLQEVLDKVFAGQKVSFEFQGSTIVVKPVKGEGRYVVKGVVKDKQTGETLPGANVRLEGAQHVGVVTSLDGTFALTFNATGQPVLSISFLGYDERRVTVHRSGEELSVELNPAEIQMAEVVKTGYYTQNRQTFTGAATNFSGTELKAVSDRDVLSTLSMLDPSFRIVDNISMGSNPNTMPDIQVRGVNALPGADVSGNGVSLTQDYKGSANLPTFILDGFEVDVEKIYDLDPNRVQSISILKDASATAIYGSRAANGVVIVETKNPQSGKLRLSYTGSVDFEVADLSQYDLLNAPEKLEYERLAGLYNGSNAVYVQEEFLKDYNERLKLVRSGVDTDWLSLPLKSVGVASKHSVLLEGGTDSFRYAVNLNYNRTAGVMKGSDRTRMGTGVKFIYNYKNLRFMNELTYGHVSSNESPYGAFGTYAAMNPYYNPYDGNGMFRQTVFESANGSLGASAVANPLYNSTLGTIDNTAYDDFTDNFSMEWNILPRLKFKGNFSLERISRRSDVFKPADHTDFIGQDTNKGSYMRGHTVSTAYNGSAVLSYFNDWNDHALSLNGGWNIQQDASDYDSYTVTGFPNRELDHPAFGAGFTEGSRMSGNATMTRLAGFLGNANYSWNDRYFVDASVRADGSSQFGNRQRWGCFWSTGLGWNLHKEAFMQKQKVVDEFRLRVSTGYTGGQNFYPFQAMMMYQYGSTLAYQEYIGAVIRAYGNNDLKWQRTRKNNYGVDFGFFGNRLSGYFNYFVETSEDMLVDINMASYLGFDSYKENLGATQNKGYEFMLKATVFRNKDWTLNLFANGQHYKNTLKRISSGLSSYNEKADASGSTAPYVRYVEGASVNTIWVVPSLGIDPATGKEIFVRKDGSYTNVWNEADYVPYATTDPKLTGTFGVNLYYKGWELNANFYYRFGGYAYNQTLVDKVENVDPYGNVDRRALYDRWQTNGVPARFKAINDLTETKPTSRFVEKDNLLTANSLSLAYTFDRKWIRHIGAEYLKLTLYANDFLYLSTMRREMGTAYPYAHHFACSVQVTF